MNARTAASVSGQHRPPASSLETNFPSLAAWKPNVVRLMSRSTQYALISSRSCFIPIELGYFPSTVKGNFPIFGMRLVWDNTPMENSNAVAKILEALSKQDVSVAEVSRRSGLPYDAIRDLKRGKAKTTSWERATLIADALGIDLSEIGEDHTPSHHKGSDPVSPDTSLIPVFDVHASAGDGMFALTEDHASSLAFPKGYLQWLTRANPRDLAIIGVKGDSMLPTLADDDIVMLDTSKTDLSYDGLFVIRDNGDALLVKRVGRASKPGHVTIISDNRALYDPVEKALSDIHVIGKVIWSGGKV